MKYLKDGTIQPGTKAPGLSEAREKLRYYSMSAAERHAYDEHLNAVMIQNDVLSSAKLEGLIEGREEGRKEGREEGRKEGREEGRKEGREEGRKEGLEKGRAEGIEKSNKANAMKMKSLGIPADIIRQVTGLDPNEYE